MSYILSTPLASQLIASLNLQNSLTIHIIDCLSAGTDARYILISFFL
ncbi:MAG: hypothetical protein ACFFAN_18745 [Promethearchaeota archaeon]